MMKREKERMKFTLWLSVNQLNIRSRREISWNIFFHYHWASKYFNLCVFLLIEEFFYCDGKRTSWSCKIKSNFLYARRVICMHDDSTSEIYHFPLSLFLREWRQTNFSDEKNIQKRIFVRILQMMRMFVYQECEWILNYDGSAKTYGGFKWILGL